MKFRFTLLFSSDRVITCDENNFPSWLNRREFKWFRDGYVLKLDAGKSVESDFWLIERIE